jgi:hypothetical protein
MASPGQGMSLERLVRAGHGTVLVGKGTGRAGHGTGSVEEGTDRAGQDRATAGCRHVSGRAWHWQVRVGQVRESHRQWMAGTGIAGQGADRI